jgi:AraC-like DNA-binding protein
MKKTNNHYIKTLVDLGGNMGLNRDQLLTDIGINQRQLNDDNYWVDNHSFTTLVKILWENCGDETLGIDPLPTPMGTWALACDYMLSAETLGDLYRRGQHIYTYLNSPLNINFSTTDTDAIIEIEAYVGVRDPQHFLIEFLNVVWHRFACWAIDETIPLKESFFSYNAPEHSWFYDELFQTQISFNKESNGFSFNKKLLTKPICRSREELACWLKDSPADLLYIPGRDSTIANHIKKTLAQDLREHMHFPAFDDICKNLYMSSQVVRRRLDEEGTSYQKIKDIVRSELIKELLSNPDIPIADITERAGFSETASLSRAFKKWTGKTPAQYRNDKQN